LLSDTAQSHYSRLADQLLRWIVTSHFNVWQHVRRTLVSVPLVASDRQIVCLETRRRRQRQRNPNKQLRCFVRLPAAAGFMN
jgi:hypothetical protein